jgi:hypothetical protein
VPKPNPTKRREVGQLVDAPAKWRYLIDQPFGRLLVVGFTGRSRRPGEKLFACKCSCEGGWFIDASAYSLTSGNTTSCGCAHSDWVAAQNSASATHGHAVGGVVTPEYRAWRAMLDRCYSVTNPAYKDYGGRGIRVYDPWRVDFQAFYDHVGPRTSPAHSLERLDNERGYEPGNVVWATPTEQGRNLRTTEYYELDGERLTLGEWAERVGIPREALHQRISGFGWTLEEAITRPLGSGGRYPTAGNDDERARLRKMWHAMISRCTNPEAERYASYGGRNITVCERWLASLDDYIDDVGVRPSPRHTLDRIDNDGNYEPDNIRWATPEEQNRNRRSTKLHALDGTTRPLAEWAEMAGMPYEVVKKRVWSGWPLEEALGTPVGLGRLREERRPWKP